MNTTQTHRRLFRCLALDGLILLAASLYAWLAMRGVALPCLFRKFTGFLCPGCGNTRAAISLLKLDFSSAFSYNPLFLLEFGYIVWIYCAASRSYLKGGRFTYQPPYPLVDVLILIIVLAWGLIRNLL